MPCHDANGLTEGVIVKGVGGLYSVATDEGVVVCSARGAFRNKKITPLVGDRVTVSGGAVHAVLSRRNELIRPRVANVDLAVIVMAAAQPEFNAGLLDRFLLTAEYAGVQAAVCVNKCELVPSDVLTRLTQPYITAGYNVIRVSAKERLGLDALLGALADKTSVFAGPSGVGKSSLINLVASAAHMETGALSERIDRGRHTTRHTELLSVSNGGFCADTPGFTSIDLDTVPAGRLADLFIEFKPFLGRCRFSDCRHDSESECAVKAAVGNAVHPERYTRYINLLHDGRR